jgi:nicotinamidase-related amidase
MKFMALALVAANLFSGALAIPSAAELARFGTRNNGGTNNGGTNNGNGNSVGGTPYVRLNKSDAALLIVDHQAGLTSIVRDFEAADFKTNVLAFANMGTYFNLPVVLTTSRETGPNGPMIKGITDMYPDHPIIERPGQINAWDNADFVAAVEATGKKQLIVAGIVTEVCVAFLTLSAIEAGYEVFVVTDASGTFNSVVRHSVACTT